MVLLFALSIRDSTLKVHRRRHRPAGTGDRREPGQALPSAQRHPKESPKGESPEDT